MSHIFLTFIYGFHKDYDRDNLWSDLICLKTIGSPWVISGDFHNVRSKGDRIGSVPIQPLNILSSMNVWKCVIY